MQFFNLLLASAAIFCGNAIGSTCPWDGRDAQDPVNGNTGNLPALDDFIFALRRTDELKEKLEKTLFDISDVESPNYNHHLTKEEISSRFSLPSDLSQAFVDFVVNRLEGENIKISSSGDFVSASLPSSRFATIASIYAFIKDSKQPEIESLVQGITVKTTNYGPRDYEESLVSGQSNREMTLIKENERSFFLRLTSTVLKDISNRFFWPGSPLAQKEAYQMDRRFVADPTNKNRQMVWGPGSFAFKHSDLKKYWLDFHAKNDLSNIKEWGLNAPDVTGSNFGEGSLDIQMITSMAPGVETVFANTNQTKILDYSFGFGEAMLEFLHGLDSLDDECLPKVVSLSLGSESYDGCNQLCSELVNRQETSSNVNYNTKAYTMDECLTFMGKQFQTCQFKTGEVQDRINDELLKLGLRGVTFLAASGDGGSHFSFHPFDTTKGSDRERALAADLNAAACTVQLATFPASSPYVLSIGGLQYTDAMFGNVFEFWESPGGAGGAGFSWRYDIPEYQKKSLKSYVAHLKEMPKNKFDLTKRVVPDVSALAWGGIPIRFNGKLIETGGTSAAAPTFAGMISMINEMRLTKGLSSLGFLNPRLYKLPADAFQDVIIGNTGTFCDKSQGFDSVEGWDPVTGFGGVNFNKLSKYLTEK